MQRMPKAINKKRLVRYKEGAEMYSMGMNKISDSCQRCGSNSEDRQNGVSRP